MVLAVIGAVALFAAYTVGVAVVAYRQGASAGRSAVERMSRILDIPNHSGEPHNFAGPPARVSQGKVKNRRNWRSGN